MFMSTLFLGDGNVRLGNTENSFMSKSLEPNEDLEFNSTQKYEATCPSECTKRLTESI